MNRLLRSALALALVAGGVGFWYWRRGADELPQFRTAQVARGDLLATVNTSGVIQPEEVVDVGAQVAGKIKRLGQDPHDSTKAIDYRSEVEENTVLAQIDDAIYRTQVAQAKANLQRAEADLLQLRAKLHLSERDFARTESLKARNATSEAEYDLAEANLETAKSALAVGEAVVAQARSSLEQAEINLGYTTIRSPVKGVILDRRVNVGQTVLASLNAPSLFLIAKDLRRLQVWAAVNEADTGQIHLGQPVQFTVDALPDETFLGEVAQIRLNATMTQNVVTYTVVVDTDNSSGRLWPYWTTSLRFETGRCTDVLLVPNGALRWRPKPEYVEAEFRGELAAGNATSPARPGDPSSATPAQPSVRKGTVWVADGKYVRPVKIQVGLSDGTSTEVVAGELKQGQEIIVGEIPREVADSTASPFAPQMFGNRRPPQ